MTTAIPEWDIFGILPPIRPSHPAHSSDRSPYRATMVALCRRFGATPERRAILRGLLDLRAALRAVGYGDGFQWIDGSFTEDVEETRGRPPGDIDVVSFLALGDAANQHRAIAENAALFASQAAKAAYRVDHYIVATDVSLDANLARRVSYWYSMWAHRREDQRWKGFVEVALADGDDAALAWLDEHDDATPDRGGADES